MDLCLHIVRRDHGAAVAADGARLAVMPLERAGGQAQFIVHAEPTADGASLEPLLRWLDAHHHETLPLARIARQAAMSSRSLSRRFREQTGTTPAQWIFRRRIRRAQQLLETSALSIERITTAVGFGSTATFRDSLPTRRRHEPASLPAELSAARARASQRDTRCCHDARSSATAARAAIACATASVTAPGVGIGCGGGRQCQTVRPLAPSTSVASRPTSTDSRLGLAVGLPAPDVETQRRAVDPASRGRTRRRFAPGRAPATAAASTTSTPRSASSRAREQIGHRHARALERVLLEQRAAGDEQASPV